MKKLNLTLIIFLLLLFSHCKKDEQSKEEFKFPYTFKTSTQSGIFEIYNNGKILNPNPFAPNYFYEFKTIIEKVEKDEIMPKITFKTSSVMNVEGYPDNNYYFRNNILYIINISDTLPFGIGSYDNFKSFVNLTYYSKSDGMGSTNSLFEFAIASNENSLEQGLKLCNLSTLTEIKALDTLALHSIVINYK